MRDGFQVINAKEMKEAFRELGGPAVRQSAAIGLRGSAVIARREVKARAPRRSEGVGKRITRGTEAKGRREPGFLAKHIIFRKVRLRSRSMVLYLIGPNRDAYYGHIVEFGSIRQPARPFMRPAAYAAAPSMFREFESKFRRALIARAARMGAKFGGRQR